MRENLGFYIMIIWPIRPSVGSSIKSWSGFAGRRILFVLFFFLSGLFLLTKTTWANQIDIQKIKHLYNVGENSNGPASQQDYTPLALEMSADNKYLFTIDRHSGKVVVLDVASQTIKISFAGRGTGAGKFFSPQDLAVFQDSTGYHVWVTDSKLIKFFRFDCDLNLTNCPVWSEHPNGLGGNGSGEGLFKEPKGIAVDSTGNVYVVDDFVFGKIQVFDKEGIFKRFIAGDADIASGTLSQPVDIAIDKNSGDIFVTITEPDHMIARFSASGAPRQPIGCAPGKGCGVKLYYPTGVAVAANNKIYVQYVGQSRNQLGFMNRFVVCLNSAGSGSFCQDEVSSIRQLSPVMDYLDFNLHGVTTNSSGELFVADEGIGQIEKFSNPTQDMQHSNVFWGRGAELGFFEYPKGIGFNKNLLSVSDGQGTRVLLYNLDDFGSRFVKAVDPLPRPGTPIGSAITDTGEIYVADPKADVVWHLNSAGNELRPHIGENPNENPKLVGPTDVFFDKDGNFYILETDKYHILAYDKSLQFTHEIGGPGNGPNEFTNPPITAVVSPDNIIFVVSLQSCEIKGYSTDGQYRKSIGGECADPENPIKNPVSITADENYIYVLEAKESNNFADVKVFSADGTLVGKFADKFGPGDDGFWQPTDIAVSNGKVAISDSLMHRVSLWGEPIACVPEMRLAGDLNCSCSVDDTDVNMVADLWHTCRAGSKWKNCFTGKQFNPLFDFNKDDLIDIFDVAYVANKKGNSCPVNSTTTSIKITNRPPIIFTNNPDDPMSLPSAKLNVFSYSGIITVKDFENDEITFKITSTLPKGLRLGSCPTRAKGELKCHVLGRPTQKGNFTIGVEAKDKTNPPVLLNIPLLVK